MDAVITRRISYFEHLEKTDSTGMIIIARHIVIQSCGGGCALSTYITLWTTPTWLAFTIDRGTHGPGPSQSSSSYINPTGSRTTGMGPMVEVCRQKGSIWRYLRRLVKPKSIHRSERLYRYSPRNIYLSLTVRITCRVQAAHCWHGNPPIIRVVP